MQTIHPTGTSRQRHPAWCRGWVDGQTDGWMDGWMGSQSRSWSLPLGAIPSAHKLQLQEGATLQQYPALTTLCSKTPARSRWVSPQVNLCQSQEFRYRFPIKENVSRQIRQKFIIFRYKDFLDSVKPLVNNADLLQISYCIHKRREVSEQRNYQKKYFHNFAGAQIMAYGRGLKG